MNHSQSSCPYVNVTSVINSLQLAIYIPTFIIGFILNSFALWIFCCCMKKYTEASIYLMNLALLDFLLVLSLPFKLHFSQQNVTVNRHLCSFLESLYFSNMYGSIYTIMFISLDRYVAIIHPFWAKILRSPKKTLIICIIIWFFVWTVAICTFSFGEDQAHINCFHNMSDNIWSIPMIASLQIFGFIIPMTVMLYCSVRIIRTLLVSVSSSVECEGSKADVIRTIVSNLVVFLISFSLSHIGIFLQFLVRKQVFSNCSVKKNISLFVQAALCIANINCCLDAICYYFAGKEFRNKLVKNQLSITQEDNIIT